MNKKIYILGGGTVQHVRPHLSLCAPAYGTTAKNIFSYLNPNSGDQFELATLGLTKMAFNSNDQNQVLIGETNEEVEDWIQSNIISNPEPSIVFLNVAFCDFHGIIDDRELRSGKDMPRLKTADGNQCMHLAPAPKVLSKIRKTRKDIFLVAWKTTAGATEKEMFEAGLRLLKQNSCNLVFVNDLHTRSNMIVTPEMAQYAYSKDRKEALKLLVEMALRRSSAEFTRTTWKEGPLKPIEDAPETFQKVLYSCIGLGAYKAFEGVTVGHFGFRDPNNSSVLWSSRRKQNYNKAGGLELCKVEIDLENNSQIVSTPIEGMKASAGARSQFHVLSKYPDLDCIIHFHCPLKAAPAGSDTARNPNAIGIREQFAFECGSTQCGLNTADGMVLIENGIAAVMLSKHGPNICFSSKIDPERVISFIVNNFDLSKRAT